MKSILVIYLKILALFIILSILVRNVIANKYDFTTFPQDVLLPAIEFSTILLVIHCLASLYYGVRGDFSTHQRKNISSGNIQFEELKQKIESKTEWEVVEENSNMIEYRTNFSIRSYGEKVLVTKNNASISIESRPIRFIALLDYGKNYQNIKKIERLLVA